MWALATPRKEPAPGQREAVFHPEFREDLRYWVETERRTALRVLALVEAILRDPLRGLGKPEPLKYLGAGVWSRRLTQEHRLVYLVSAERVDFLQARYHYRGCFSGCCMFARVGPPLVARAPNQALEPTAYSFGFAYASGGGSPLVVGHMLTPEA